MKKWILNLLIVVFMIAFSGNVYALDTDYKVNDQTYSTLEEAVEAINIGNEDEYVLMIPDKEETLNLDGLQKSITIKREKLVNQESSSLKEIVVSNSTENQIEVKLEKISPTKANLTNTKLVLGDTNDALEIDKSSKNFSVDTGDGQDTVTYPFSSLDTTNVINCEKFISTSDTLNVKGNKEINKDEQTGNVVIDQMYFTQLTKLIVEGQNIEVTLNTPISEIDLGGNKAIVNSDEKMTIKNGNVVVNTAVDKVYQNNMLNNLSLEEISNLEIKSGKLNVKDLNAVVEKENDQSSVTLSNSTMKIIYDGTQLLLNDTEIIYTIQNQELEYTIPYQNADISINNDLVSIINKDNQNQKIQFKINGLQKLILKGNEFDNTYTFSMNTSVGLKVTINGELGNDTLNIVNQLEGSSISLEIDMENVNLMNSDSTNKSVHVNSLGFGGTTSNIDSTGFDYNVSGIFNIDLSYRVDNTINPNIKEHVSLRNGQIQANEIKINALANANISHETNSVGLANVKMNMGVELILENMKLISQAGITIKAGIEVDAQVSTGTGTSHLAVITSYADLKASITIKNSTLEAHGAVSIESENTFNSTMVSTGNHGEGQSKDSGGYVVFNIFKQNADVYVQAKITTPQDLTIRSNVITNHSLSSTVAQDGASGTDAAKTLQTLLEELKGKVDNNDIVNKLSDLLISVLGTANSIDSTLSSTKIRLLGQQVGAGVFNYGTISNKAQFLAQEGTNIRNLKILADRTTTTNIQVDGSAVSEQGYFSSKGYGAGFGLNYLHIDQLASLMENSSLAAHALNILSNGQNEYILNVKAGYVKEGFGTGGAIAGQYIYLKNESLMNTKNPIQLSSAMAVKAIENSTMKMNCGTQEGETKTVGSSIGLVFFIDQVKAYVNKSTLGDLTQLEVIAESDLNSQLNLRAGGNGGTSVAPAYAIHTVLSNVVAQMDADVSTNGSVSLLAKSDKYVDTEVISDLMAECPGKGTSIALNVVSGYLRSLLNGNVNARDVKVNTYHVLRSDVYTLASPDGSTDEDDRTTLEKLKPNNLYNKAKESIQSSLNQFKETISNFNIMDALFEVSFDTTEGEVQKAGTLAIQLFKGDALAQVNGTINASGNVKIISEGAMNSFVLSSANTGEGTSKASGMSMAVIAGSYQNYAIMSGNIQHASSLTIESKGMATSKKDEGGEIITNDVNTFYINSLSGATSDGKTTAGAVTLVYLKQDYQAILEGNAIVDNNITVNSIIKEKIISNALSQASHNFGISIGWKNKVKGTGIGVVINFIDTSSKAIIGGKNNSINIKANSIDVKSIYQTDIKAKAEIGGEGKTTTAMATLDAGVLVNIINPVIYAKIDNVNLDVSNEVNVQGEYSGSTSGEVSAEAVSNGKSKGGAVTVLYIESDIQSYVNASGTIQGALNVEALANVYNTIDAEASAEGALLGDYASVLNIDLKQELKSQIKGKSTPLSSLAGKLAGKLGNNPGTSLSSGLLTKKDISTPDQATQEKGKTQKGKEVSIAAAVAYMNLKHGVYASVVGNNLNVGSLKVEASNHSNYKIKAVGNSESNGKSASLGIGLILSENRTQASLGGILTSNGNIDINSIYMQNYDPNYINDLAIEVYTTAKAKSDKGTKQSNAITVSGAGVYLESNDQTTAKIDSNATIKASNISINALEKSKYAIRAWAFDKSEENNSKGVGIAFAMLNINGSVLSYVDDGSSIIANDLSLSSLKPDVDEQKFELNLDFSGFKGDIENLNLEGLKDNVINNLLKFTKVFSMHNYYIDVIGGGSTENGGLVATGSAGVLTFKDKMKSYIGKDVTLNLNGKLTLNANNDTSILMISGALSKGGKASIGLNTLVYINENEVSTYIDERSTINASSTEMKSSDNKSLMLLSLTGALDGDKVALGGAVNTILSQNKVSTEIKEGVQLTTKGDISLISENDLKGKNLMFNIEDSNTAAVGASVAYIDILNKTYTNIGNNVVIKVQVDYAGYLLLKALATENLMSILFGAGNSDKAAINASVAYKNITSDTRATIGNGSTIKVSHLDMLAEDHTKMMGVIGGITISKKVGIGGASDVNEFNKKVYAHIGNSKVNVKYNLTAKVNSEDYILSIVVGLGGGSNAAVTGSVPVTTIKNDLDAHIDSDEDILVGRDLVVEATQNDTLIIYAGAISGSKTAAVGLSATNVIISGQIKAYLDVKNLKTNSVTILTNKKDKFSFGSVAGSVSGSISVTGAELTILVNTVMSSYIADDSNLSITKSLTIKANHEIDSTSSTGQLAGASTTAIGAGVLVYKLELTVNSYVGNNVTVLNELEGPIIIVADSKNKLLFVVVGVAASGTTSVNGNAATILITNKVNAFVGNSSTLQTNGNMLIYANDQQDLNADLGSAAVAGTAGINVSALVIILKSETKSSIGDATKIIVRGNGEGISYNGKTYTGLNVLAQSTQNIQGVAITAAGGTAAVNPNALVMILNNKVIASIGTGAVITCGADVSIQALSTISLDATVGGATGGQAAVNPGVIYISSNKTIQALINGTINANNMDVLSSSKATFRGVLAGASFGEVAVNAITLVLIIDDTIEAKADTASSLIGNKVQVKAYNYVNNAIASASVSGGLAAVGAQATVLKMTSNVHASVYHVCANTLNVIADSNEQLTVYATGASGGLVGVAGSVTVVILKNNMSAGILANAEVNANNVNVQTNDRLTLDALAGSVSAGAVGVGAAVNVIIIRNTTHSFIGENVVINGNSQNNALRVSATTDVTRIINAKAVSGAAAGVAGSTSILVINIGKALDNDMNKALSDSENNTNRIEGIQESLNASKNNLRLDSKYMSLDQLDVNILGDIQSTDSTIEDANSATVGQGATINTNDFILIARDNTQLDAICGSAGVGLASVGGAVSVITIGNNVFALFDGTVNATNSIQIQAISDQSTYKVSSISGGAGYVGSLGANVAILNIKSQVKALLQSHAQLNGFKSLSILAKYANDSGDMIQIIVGSTNASLGLSAGATVLTVKNNANVAVEFADNANIDASQGDIDVEAYTKNGMNIKGYSTAGGIVSGDALVLVIVTSSQSSTLIGGLYISAKSLKVRNKVMQPITITVGQANVGGATAGALALTVTNNVQIENKLFGTITTSGDINLITLYNSDADGNKLHDTTINATTLSGGFVGGTGIGENITDNSVIKNTLSGTINAKDIQSLIAAYLQIVVSNVGGNAGVYSGSVKVIILNIQSTITNKIADNAKINANTVDLTNLIRTFEKVSITGVSFGSVNVGVTSITATINPTLTVQVGENAEVKAQDIRLKNWYNTNPVSSSNSKPSSLENVGIEIHTTSMSGALVGAQGTITIINHNTKVQTIINRNGKLIAGNSIEIINYGSFDAKSDYNSLQVGFVSIGANVIEVNLSGTVSLVMQESSELSAGGDVSLITLGYGHLVLNTSQASGGLISGGENSITLKGTYTIKTELNNSVKIISTNGTITLLTTGYVDVNAKVEGKSLSGISVGASQFTNSNKTEVSIVTGKGVQLQTAGDLVINVYYLGSYDITLITSAGALVGAIANKLVLNDSSDVVITIGINNILKGKTIDISTLKAYDHITVNVEGVINGIITLGRSELNATIGGHVETNIQSGTQITSTSDMTIASYVDFEGISLRNYAGTEVALASNSKAASYLTITGQPRTIFGNNVILNSNGNVNIIARIENIKAELYTESPVVKEFAGSNTVSAEMTLNLAIFVDLGDHISITASRDLNIITAVKALDLYVYSYSKVYAADTTTKASSTINIQNVQIEIIGKNAKLSAYGKLNIQALTGEDIKVHTYAFSEIGAGVTGKVYANSIVNLSIVSRISLTGTGEYSGKDIYIYAQAPIENTQNFNRETHCESKTVVNYVHKAITKVIEVVEKVTQKITKWLPWPLNHLVKWIVKTVTKLVTIVEDIIVREILGSEVKENVSGSFTSSSDIYLEGTLSYGTSTGIHITIDENEKITGPDGLQYRKDGNNIYLDQLGSLSSGACKIISATGTLRGKLVIKKKATLSDITIENNSSYNIYIGDLDLTNSSNIENADYLIQCYEERNGLKSDYKITEEFDGTVAQTVISITSSKENSNIYFNGKIHLANAKLVIDTKGNTYTTSQAELIVGSMYATFKDMGSKDQLFNVFFTSQDGTNEEARLSLRGSNAYLVAELYNIVDNLEQDNTTELVLIIEQFVITGNCEYTIPSATISDGFSSEDVTYVEGQGDESKTYKVVKLDENGKPVLDKNGNYVYEGEITIDNKSNSTNSTIKNVSVVIRFIGTNEAENFVLNDISTDTQTRIVFEKDSTIKANTVTININGSIQSSNDTTYDILANKAYLHAKQEIKDLRLDVSKLEATTDKTITLINNVDRNVTVNLEAKEDINVTLGNTVIEKIYTDGNIDLNAKDVAVQNDKLHIKANKLTANVNTFGTSEHKIQTEIQTLDLESAKNVYMNQKDDLQVEKLKANETIDLQAKDTTIKEMSGKDIKLDVGNLELESVTATNTVDIQATGNVTGSKLQTGYHLGAESIHIQSAGSINNLKTDTSVLDINAGKSITLINNVDKAVVINLQAKEDIDVTLGNTVIEKIYTNGNIDLNAKDVAVQNDKLHIKANKLTANVNTFGTSEHKIQTEIQTLDLESAKNVYMNQKDDLQVEKLKANETIDLQAKDTTIKEMSGKDIKLDVGNLELESVTATNTVDIQATGNVTGSKLQTGYHLGAESIHIQSAGSINNLKTDTSVLDINAGKSITLINNVDKAVVINLQAKEDIDVTLGNTVIEKIYTNGNIDLNAKDVAVQNDKLHIKANKLTANVNTFGTSEHKIQTEIQTLDLESAKNVYMNQKDDLQVEKLKANETIDLQAKDTTIKEMSGKDIKLDVGNLSLGTIKATEKIELKVLGNVTGDEREGYHLETPVLDKAEITGGFGTLDQPIKTNIDVINSIVSRNSDICIFNNLDKTLTINTIEAANGWIQLVAGEIIINHLLSKNLSISTEGDLTLDDLNIYERVILNIGGNVQAIQSTHNSLTAQMLNGNIRGFFGTSEMPIRLKTDCISLVANNDIYTTSLKNTDDGQDYIVDQLVSNNGDVVFEHVDSSVNINNMKGTNVTLKNNDDIIAHMIEAKETLFIKTPQSFKSIDEDGSIKAEKLIINAGKKVKVVNGDVENAEIYVNDGTIDFINNLDKDITVNLEAKENINVTLGNTVIEKIYTNGNIDLNAKDVAVQNDKLHIKANKLTANVNTFGTSEHKIQTEIQTLDLESAKNVYMNQKDDLQVEKLKANETIDLQAKDTTIKEMSGKDIKLDVGNLELESVTATNTVDIQATGNVTGSKLQTGYHLGAESIHIQSAGSINNLKTDTNRLDVDVEGNIEITNNPAKEVNVRMNAQGQIKATLGNVILENMSTNGNIKLHVEDLVVANNQPYHLTANELTVSSNNRFGNNEYSVTMDVNTLNAQAKDLYFTNNVDKTLNSTYLLANNHLSGILGNGNFKEIKANDIYLQAKNISVDTIESMNLDLIAEDMNINYLNSDIIHLQGTKATLETIKAKDTTIRVDNLTVKDILSDKLDIEGKEVLVDTIKGENTRIKAEHLKSQTVESTNLAVNGKDIEVGTVTGTTVGIDGTKATLETIKAKDTTIRVDNLTVKDILSDKLDIEGKEVLVDTIKGENTRIKAEHLKSQTVESTNLAVNGKDIEVGTVTGTTVGIDGTKATLETIKAKDTTIRVDNLTVKDILSDKLDMVGNEIVINSINANDIMIQTGYISLANIKGNTLKLIGQNIRLQNADISQSIDLSGNTIITDYLRTARLKVVTPNNLVIKGTIGIINIQACNLDMVNDCNLTIESLKVANTTKLSNNGNVIGSNIQSPILTVNASGIINLNSTSDVIDVSGKDVYLTNSRSARVKAKGNTVDLTIAGFVEFLGNDIQANQNIRVQAQGIKGFIQSPRVTLNSQGNVDVQLVTSFLDAIIQGNAIINNQGNLYIQNLSANNIELTNRGQVTSRSGSINADSFKYTIDGDAQLSMFVSALQGKANKTVIDNNNDLILRDLQANGLEIKVNGLLKVIGHILSQQLIAIEANSMELKDGSIQTSDQLTIKTQDKLNLSSAAKSKETVINAGKENNLVISDSMGNVTINALNQNDSTFDILLKDYLHTFVLNGNNYQQKIKMILDQNNQATIFIHGKEGQNQLDVDLTKNTGKTTITVDKVNKLGFVLSNKNDQYTIDRNGLQISNNKMNIDVKTKGIKKLNIDDLGGNNKFTFIDTFANTNVSSGNGNDQFYFGVITNKSRYATRTNEGYLSRGTSHNVTIKAGNGNNLFRIYSSLGKLNIEAGNGNDRFILKVFAYWSKDNKYKSYKNGTITIDGGKGHNVLEII